MEANYSINDKLKCNIPQYITNINIHYVRFLLIHILFNLKFNDI